MRAAELAVSTVIGNVFKNHITVIENNYIAIHIDIELLSSPSLTCEFLLNMQLNRVVEL